MTTPSIISDQEAREIAGYPQMPSAKSPLGIFAATGEITKRHVRIAERRLNGEPPSVLPADHPLRPFYAYIAHYGERGPQPDWSER